MLTDQGSDTNIIQPHILPLIMEANPGLSLRKLSPPRKFSLTDADVEPIVVDRCIKLNANLPIRLGCKMTLRGVECSVTDSKMN